MTSLSAGQGKEIPGAADLGPGPLARGHPEPFGAVGEKELHVPSETIGRFRHMLFTWH
ncbi:unnamed protein product [Penicillium camemberti]|uniref:Str. FM013 n=1 Tax=Penicillium camemberti (strain FM 013) TaxID=1429867 RepID=A0A0G4PEX1_PENC3|nr:unnamed protein product [Penicillium camemberti]